MKKGVKKSGKNFRGVTINIHLTNRWLYTLVFVGVLLIIGVGVYAGGTSNPTPTSGVLNNGTYPNPGHPIDQIGAPVGCESGDILTYNVNSSDYGYWNCTSATNALSFSGPSDCSSGQVLTYNSTGWYCVDMLSSGASGPTEIKLTSSTHDGYFYAFGSACADGSSGSNGYQCMNNWIQSHGCSGYHVCSASEITQALSGGASFPSNSNWVNVGWYSAGLPTFVPGYNDYANDCNGWTCDNYQSGGNTYCNSNWQSEGTSDPVYGNAAASSGTVVYKNGSYVTLMNTYYTPMNCGTSNYILCCK